MNQRQLHVVFGAGQIGPPLARILASRGHEVRLVRRGTGAPPEGVALVSGDAANVAFATEVTRGAAAVYHCMNPVYEAKTWARELPRLADSLIAAAGRASARLVVLDNLYMLGTPAATMSESTPDAPRTRKGLIRAEVAARFFAAHARGDARIVIGRASDFYGPGGLGTHFGEMFWREALTKGTAPLLVNPETPHAYTFTLDVAAALAALGEAADDGVTGRWWVLPTAPAEPTRALVARFARALGRELRVRVMPPLMRRIAGLFVPVLRELEEMLPSWEVPYALDDGWFRERFALPATPPDEGARLTLEWARARFADAR